MCLRREQLKTEHADRKSGKRGGGRTGGAAGGRPEAAGRTGKSPKNTKKQQKVGGGVEEAKADKSGKIKGSRAGGWKMDGYLR